MMILDIIVIELEVLTVWLEIQKKYFFYLYKIQKPNHIMIRLVYYNDYTAYASLLMCADNLDFKLLALFL